MTQTLFLVSPSTQEILPYHFNSTDTFEPIISDLQTQGKPNNLLYYNGLQSIPISTDYQIESFFPQRQNQVLIYAFHQPQQPFSLLTIPANKILILLLKWDLSQFISLFLDPLDTVEQIIKYIQDQYDWSVSLTKLQGNQRIDLVNEQLTINQILPFRTEQILLLMEDQSLVIEQIAQLQDLPDELIIQVLLQLPLASLSTVCRLSKRLAQFCQDKGLWQQLVLRDFGLIKKSALTWLQEYQRIKQAKPYELLLDAARTDNLRLANYAINQGAQNYNLAFTEAAEYGQIAMIELLRNVMLKKNILPDYNDGMFKASIAGHLDVIELMINWGAINYNNTLAAAAQYGHLAIIQRLLPIMAEQGIQPQYFRSLSTAVRNGQLEVVQFLINLAVNLTEEQYHNLELDAAFFGQIKVLELLINFATRRQIRPDYNEILGGAASQGHLEIMKMILEIMAQRQITPDYQLALNEAVGHVQPEVMNEIIRLMQERQIEPNYNEAIFWAAAANQPSYLLSEEAKQNQINLITKLFDLGATNYNQVASTAAEHGFIELVKFVLDQMRIKNIPVDYLEILLSATESGNRDTVQLILNQGINQLTWLNYQQAINTAKTFAWDEIVELIEDFLVKWENKIII